MEIVYIDGRRRTIFGILFTTFITNNQILEITDTDFEVIAYEDVSYSNQVRRYEVTRDISKEKYNTYKNILEHPYYGDYASLHILNEPTQIVMDDVVQKIVKFLNEDKTNDLAYVQASDTKQTVFAKQLSVNATEHNLSLGVVILSKKNYINLIEDYSLNYFSSNEQMYFIDPMTDEIITVCEVFDFGYGYGKLYPDGTNVPLKRSKILICDFNLSEFCNQRIIAIPNNTQITTLDLDITLKSGYTLYQNNEYSYSFGYPEDWAMVDVGLSENMLQGVGMSHDTTGSGSMIVVVYSIDPKSLWDEMGGLDKLIEAGYIITARNTTVNDRVAFEVVPSETFMSGSIVKYVTIQANGYYYMMTLWGLTSDEIYSYSTQPDKFDDIVNSWVIGNIE